MKKSSAIEAACKGKALIKMDKMLELSWRGNEKLGGEGSMAMGAKKKPITISSGSSVVEIDEEKMMPEHSGAANHGLMAEVSEVLRAKEKESCNSWVVEMETARWKQKCIYRVPEFIKKMTRDAYQPQFVSLGPMHHGEPHLLPMEEHKRRAVLHVVNRSGKPLREYLAAIEEVAEELEAAYDTDLDEKWRGANRGRFVEMMVTDGCFLLELMRIDEILVHGEVDDDYGANDPIFSGRSFLDLWPIMRDDMIAMEIQVPLVVLQRLLAVQRGMHLFPEYYVSSLEINYKVARLLDVACEAGMDKLGLHFLDIFHKSYCGISLPHCEESDNKYGPRTPCAVELSEAGIQFKTSTTNSVHDVDFENSMLSMPLFKLNGSTETMLLNVMVFEWLHPDAKRDVRSYISFVDDIIESENDVTLLRSKGIIENLTVSDKKVVEIFNTLTKLSRVPIRGSRLGHVQWKVNAHCKKRWNKWRASFVKTYLSNPWLFLSLVAAVILLIATLLQTVYTILPLYKG